jgi:cell division protein FtsB
MQGIRHYKESFFHTRFWIAVLIVICTLLVISVVKISKKYMHAKSIRDDYQTELNQVESHEAELKKNINALSTDRGKETEIRDRYRVVKEGEQMILIVNNDKKEDQIPPEPPKPVGIFPRIGHWLSTIFQ